MLEIENGISLLNNDDNIEELNTAMDFMHEFVQKKN